MIPPVVASERGTAQTSGVARRGWGCRTATLYWNGEWKYLESYITEGDNPVHEAKSSIAVSWVTRDTRNPARICRDHPVRLNTPMRPIANQYCEGKVKSTPMRRVKEILKPCAYKRSEQSFLWRRAFCIMNLRVTITGKVKDFRSRAAVKASLKRASSRWG